MLHCKAAVLFVLSMVFQLFRKECHLARWYIHNDDIGIIDDSVLIYLDACSGIPPNHYSCPAETNKIEVASFDVCSHKRFD